MTNQRVNYDQIASDYDQRFTPQNTENRREALLKLVGELEARRVLEVGCGTSYWLEAMFSAVQGLYGLDPSAGMLSQARNRKIPMRLIRGYARQLPFDSSVFDLVFCVNAIHHFEAPRAFICEAYRVLRVGGMLAVVGSDPRQDSWYGYHYFEGTYETALMRFPAWGTVSEWMVAEGFERVGLKEVERIIEPKHGRGVLDDPFLRKNSCSQLALLADETYEAGLQRIEAALVRAEARGETIIFQTDISVAMLTGLRPNHRS